MLASMSSIPGQATAHKKTPFDEVIEKNLASISDEEIRELQSDQTGEITEALRLLCKTDSIHLRQSRLRRWNHRLAKYIGWLPAILDVLSDPLVMSFPESHTIYCYLQNAARKGCILTLLRLPGVLSLITFLVSLFLCSGVVAAGLACANESIHIASCFGVSMSRNQTPK